MKALLVLFPAALILVAPPPLHSQGGAATIALDRLQRVASSDFLPISGEEFLQPSRAQLVGIVTGRVRDAATGQPLASVQIFIAGDLNIGGLSRAAGR